MKGESTGMGPPPWGASMLAAIFLQFSLFDGQREAASSGVKADHRVSCAGLRVSGVNT